MLLSLGHGHSSRPLSRSSVSCCKCLVLQMKSDEHKIVVDSEVVEEALDLGMSPQVGNSIWIILDASTKEVLLRENNYCCGQNCCGKIRRLSLSLHHMHSPRPMARSSGSSSNHLQMSYPSGPRPPISQIWQEAKRLERSHMPDFKQRSAAYSGAS